MGNYELALDFLKKSVLVSGTSQGYSQRINSAYRIAFLKYKNGNYHECIEIGEKSLNLNSNNLRSTIYNSRFLWLIAQSEFEIGKVVEANSTIDLCIELREKLSKQNEYFVLTAIDVKLKYLLKLGKLKEAQALFNTTIRKFPLDRIIDYPKLLEFYVDYCEDLIENDFLRQANDILGNIADWLEWNKQVESRKHYELKKYLKKYFRFRSVFFRKKFYETDGINFLDSAYENFSQYVRLSREDINAYKSDKSRIKQYEDFNYIQSEMALIKAILYENSNKEKFLIESFDHTQLSKSSQLLETLNRNLAFQQTNIPDSLTIQLSSLKQQASYLSTQINKLENKEELSESDSSRLSDFRSVLLDNKVAFNDLMLYLEKTFPKYYEINYNPKIATIQDVQGKLVENEALIEYFVGNEHIYAFTISQDTATVLQLATVSDSSISRFREIIIPKGIEQNLNVAYRQYVDQSYQLYKQLLAKPLEVIGKSKTPINKLYIIPDKSLNYLAFDLLLTEKIEKNRFVGYGKLPYLINDYNISYGYSASILFREDSTDSNSSFNGKVLAFAPSYEKLLSDSSILNELGQFRNSLSPLRYNKSEVDGISRFFNAQVFKSTDATEKNFVENMTGKDILHFAMHGLVDSKDSEKSRLVFTPVEDSVHDNYLHNFELYNLNIDAKLAVLSACNTGYGKLEGGEGVMSLARAFTYAGTKSVVMSQWPADDEASSVIMQFFYSYLADGMRKDDALRLAKLDYLEQANPAKRNPFYWNNFVVMGDVSPLVKDNTRLYIYIGLAVLGILLMIVFGRRYFTKGRV
ncbi:MAG: CHAT domain-containing protein [Bacteroidota bacterium]